MAKRFTDTDKWKKPFIRSLKAPYKLLWLYILDECDHAGIWQIDIEVANIKIGEKINLETALLQFDGRVIKIDDKLFIPDFVEFQYGKLNPENRAHKSVIDILSKHNLLNDEFEIKPLASPLEGAKDKAKDKELDKDIAINRGNQNQKDAPYEHWIEEFIQTKLKQVSKMKYQMDLEDMQEIDKKFKEESIKKTLDSMDNFKDLTKKYVKVGATLRNWLAREGEGAIKQEFSKYEALREYNKQYTDDLFTKG